MVTALYSATDFIHQPYCYVSHCVDVSLTPTIIKLSSIIRHNYNLVYIWTLGAIWTMVVGTLMKNYEDGIEW